MSEFRVLEDLFTNWGNVWLLTLPTTHGLTSPPTPIDVAPISEKINKMDNATLAKALMFNSYLEHTIPLFKVVLENCILSRQNGEDILLKVRRELFNMGLLK